MSDGVDREGDAVLDADFAHQLGDVRFDGALFDAQGGADFLVGASGDQHFENFFFAIGEADAARRKMRPGAELTRSMNMESTRRGAQTEP